MTGFDNNREESNYSAQVTKFNKEIFENNN